MPDTAAATKVSTMQPFAKGDLLLGATDLNVPTDDHAGDGRIFQFDKDMNLKGVLYTTGTTHLVKGLNFGPDGLLWALDSAEHAIIWVDPKTGKQVNPGYMFPSRPWSSAIWDKAGNTFLYEHITGTLDKVPEKYRAMTKLVPGTDRAGYGHVYKFDKAGKLLKEFNTETSTSFAGHLGVTSCVLHPSEQYVIYTTETSKRIMRYDVVNDRQMPDLMTLPQEAREFVFCLGLCVDGTLLATRGAKWEHIDEAGKVIRSYPLEGPGWAIIKESLDRRHVFVNSFFTGQCIKVEKETGKTVGTCTVPAQRSLAGFAEYAG
jgi:sugar lactone lactonase YvrE